MQVKEFDALVIGGGFFGCMIAVALRGMGVDRVLVAERLDRPLLRASQVNQARIHRGYHYPRDAVSAMSSARHFHRFQEDFASTARHDLITHYAIARNSKVTPTQFENFCRSVGIPLWQAAPSLHNLVEPDLIEELYRVEETVFDCDALRVESCDRMRAAGVELALSTEITGFCDVGSKYRFLAKGVEMVTDMVFNATYAEIDCQGIPIRTPVKREWVEVTLIKPPVDLAGTGLTIMDGPFFSVMPFPSRQCHTLTHVRYTPVFNWIDSSDAPQVPFIGFGASTQGEAMLRDAIRYVPCMRHAEILGSLYDVKAVLVATEDSDARPILIEKAEKFPRVYSVLGGKIDNIYDILDELPAMLSGNGATQAPTMKDGVK